MPLSLSINQKNILQYFTMFNYLDINTIVIIFISDFFFLRIHIRRQYTHSSQRVSVNYSLQKLVLFSKISEIYTYKPNLPFPKPIIKIHSSVENNSKKSS